MLKKRLLWILCTAIASFAFHAPGLPAQVKDSSGTIQEGSLVSFEYTLKDDEGHQIESNRGKTPLQYTHGSSQIIPGLENKLEGMQAGEKKTVRVAPKDAYGEVNPAAFQEVPREKIPPEALEVGSVLAATGPQGQTRPIRVHEVKDKTVILDLNHPLAGKTLVFDVKIIEVQAMKGN